MTQVELNETRRKHWELIYGLRNFSCHCKFSMDIRGRCVPFQLTGIEKEDEYYSYKHFIDRTYQTFPYKLKSAEFYIKNDACSCQIRFDDEDEFRSFISNYEELFSLTEVEMDTLYKMIILDSNDSSLFYESMEDIDSVYQKYIESKKPTLQKKSKKIYRLLKKKKSE